MFGAQFLPVFAGLLLIYSWILPPYESGVVACANSALGYLSPLASIRVMSVGRWRVHMETPELAADFTVGGDHHATLLFLNLIILPALLFATPARLMARLRLVAMGVALLFVLHVLTVAGCVYGMSVINEPKSLVFRSLPRILRLSGQGLAIALWGALTWRYWFGRGGAND